MSRKDYTKYSKSEPVVETAVEPVAIYEPVEENVSETPMIGIVTNCLRLNVRKTPSPTAEVLCTVDAKHDLVIDMDESTDDYYKICTEAGIEGYCVKYFVTIKP